MKQPPSSDVDDDYYDGGGGVVTKKRLGRSQYDAMDIHGFYGLIDTKTVHQGNRLLTLHIPPRSSAYCFDLRQGDLIHVNSMLATQWGRRTTLDVGFVTAHDYFPPGRKVTAYTVGVPEYQWEHFVAK
jgi:hypothetical protein